MEVNTMSGTAFGRGPAGGSKWGAPKADNLRREGRYHDKEIHETMYINPGAGGAARLLDSDEQGFERGASRAERHRKQLAEKEKERELAKKLGAMGNGAGSDYMRVKGAAITNLPARGDTATQPENASSSSMNPVSATDLSTLLHRKAEDVSLAPVKRKRVNTGKSMASRSEERRVGKECPV